MENLVNMIFDVIITNNVFERYESFINSSDSESSDSDLDEIDELKEKTTYKSLKWVTYIVFNCVIKSIFSTK